MTFRTKMLIAFTVAALVPVVLLGWLSYRANRAELVESVGRSERLAAEQAARYAEKTVLQYADTLRALVASIPFGELSADEVGTVLALPYRQLPQINALAMLDGNGDAIAPSVDAVAADAVATGRVAMTADELEVFASKVPLSLAISAGMALGPPYRSGAGDPRVVVAVRVSEDPMRVLAAELSLRELTQMTAELSRSSELAVFVDAAGETIAGTDLRFAEARRFVGESLRAGSPSVRTLEDPEGAAYLAAFAPMSALGWGVLLAKRGDVAFRAAERVRDYSLFWAGVALVLAIVVAVTLARGLTGPITELSRAARALTDGDYDRQVPVASKDELGEFGAAFNHMASEVKRRNAEIRRWNEELQQRVNQRTAELKAAQSQIERTRRLAALASMGAGVAHEVNNPMTALIGMVTLAREEVGEKSSPGEMLGIALDEADRITRIVDALRRMSERERNPVGKRFSLAQPIKAVLEHQRAKLEERRIRANVVLPEGLPPMEGDPRQIQQALENLVQNAIEAMPDGGTLDVTAANVEGALKLVVRDTGKGISNQLLERVFDPFFTTKQSRGHVGLGLSTAHSIVELHHGQILVESAEGRGTAFTVVLPAATADAHLA